MQMRIILNRITPSVPTAGASPLTWLAPLLVTIFAWGGAIGAAGAQDVPAKRLASIVSVAVDEYGKGVDATGRVTVPAEYEEAIGFLGDAKSVASRLSGGNTAKVRALLDSLAAAMRAKMPPAELAVIHASMVSALGKDGALDMPTRLVNLDHGANLFARNCMACHGVGADGSGVAAAPFVAPPPSLVAPAMRDVSPAAMYRIVSVGVSNTAMAGWATSLSPDERWDVVSYLVSLRSNPAERALGAQLALTHCPQCRARSNAATAAAVAPVAGTLAPELASFAWTAERSDVQLERIVADARVVVSSTRLPLAPVGVRAVVAWARALPSYDAASIVAANVPEGGARSPAAEARTVIALIDDALAAARAARVADAGDKAFDAYLAFEPLETSARAAEPSRVTAMERHFAEFKGAVKSGDIEAAQRARDTIVAGLPRMVELAQPSTSTWELFLQSFLIILREGFEAILVVGAVVAFLVKTGHRERLPAIWKGVALAIVASAGTAVVLATMLSAIPASREIVEGATMLIAVAVLFSVSYWLISKVDAARWQQFIREQVNVALEHGGGTALAFVGFLAVYREGAETALFYQALFRQAGDVVMPLSLGMLAGAGALAVIFVLFYRFGVRIPMRPFFAVTSALLYTMAFVFMGKGIRELQEGNAMSLTLLPGWPAVDALGLFPSRETMIAQGLLLALLAFALVKTFVKRRPVAVTAAAVPVVVPPPVGEDVPAHAHVDLEGRVAELAAKANQLQERLVALEAELQRERLRKSSSRE